MEKIWLKNYQEGVPINVDFSQYESLGELLEDAMTKYASKKAFTCMGTTLKYADIEEESRYFASYLSGKLGLLKGDRIAIMLPNILQYPVALFAALRLGLVVVNVNPLYTARELEHQLKDSGADTIVIVENFAHVLQEVCEKTQIKNIVVTGLGDLLNFPKSWIVNFVIRTIKKMVPPYDLPKAIPFLEALRIGSNFSYERANVSQTDLAFLQYTGGTTGVAKGAMLSHRNLLANVAQAKAWISPSLSKEEVVITALPLYHIFSLTANCLTYTMVGAENVLITNPRDIKGMIKEMSKVKFTAFTGVNTLFNALLNHPDFAKLDFSTLRATLGGGMAVQRAVAEKWFEVTQAPLIQAYGLTETSPAACINPFHIKMFNGSIGVPISSTEVAILDDNGQEFPLGQSGEICISGPQVMQGYWQRPDETAQVMFGKWFRTGDIGFMDKDGFVTLVDRKKEMILVSGFNVYPNEIEDVLALHPGILESAAIGVPDEKSGEAVKVYINRKDPGLTSDQVIAHCRKHLTGYKVPKYVEFRTDLPKSSVGKILRRMLKGA